jgi:hypothetical protein
MKATEREIHFGFLEFSLSVFRIERRGIYAFGKIANSFPI